MNWVWDHIIKVLIISKLDPIAWAIKYLIDASVSWFEFEFNIIGIKDSKFSSRANHNINQFLLEIAMRVLVIITIYVIDMNGVKLIIKVWLELNHQIWVRSSYFTRYYF